MIRLLAACLLLTGCQAASAEAEYRFPQDWCGQWCGELEVFGARPRKVPMELHLEPVGDAFTWKIIYGEGSKRQVRDYVLRVVDAAKGRFEVDEQNSIVLPATFRNGVLAQSFAVGTSALAVFVRRDDETLRFEVFAGPRERAVLTGGDGAPKVEGFEFSTRQEAVLRRRVR